MMTGLRFGAAFLALTYIFVGSTPNPAIGVTAEVARKCKALTDTAFPPRQPGNPAAGSLKGSGRAAQDYFNKCVADGGKMEGGAAK